MAVQSFTPFIVIDTNKVVVLLVTLNWAPASTEWWHVMWDCDMLSIVMVFVVISQQVFHRLNICINTSTKAILSYWNFKEDFNECPDPACLYYAI